MSNFQKRKETTERHKSMHCHVFSLKIDKSHLSKKNREYLTLLFLENKWFYNYCIAQEDRFKVDTKIKQVQVKIGDIFESRDLKVLPAQSKQAIKSTIEKNIKMLKTKQDKGIKVGALKFKSECNSIPLPQYKKAKGRKESGTYQLDFIKNKIRIGGTKKWLRVRGLKQIPKDAEICNANLIHKNGDYYLNVVTFTKAEDKFKNKSIGIDFGCSAQMTFSNDTKVEFEIPVNKNIKRLSRKISKRIEISKTQLKEEQNKLENKNKKLKRIPSKNELKLRNQRNKEYAYLTNIKSDIRKKIINAITSNYGYVCFQDESIHAWAMSGHGKKIQNTGIGRIISDLKSLKSVMPIMVSKFFPSTKLCPKCDKKNTLLLSDRTYICPVCSYTKDRDIKAAICIEIEGRRQIELDERVPMGYRELTLGENLTSTFFDKLNLIPYVKMSKLNSVNQEACFIIDR